LSIPSTDDKGSSCGFEAGRGIDFMLGYSSLIEDLEFLELVEMLPSNIDI
jgi:hypothetical protein